MVFPSRFGEAARTIRQVSNNLIIFPGDRIAAQ